MRKAIVVVAALAALAVVNWTIASREELLASGRVVLLELAPVDPRSLMQGDYMALRFKVAEQLGAVAADATDGYLVVRVADDRVASFVRFDDGAPVAADELRLRYRWRDGRPKFATNAFFFEEGRANDFANARYGEFRVSGDGDMILTGMRDAQRGPLGVR